MALTGSAATGPAQPGRQAHPARSASRGRGLVLLYLGCLLMAGAYGLTLLLPAFVKAAGGSALNAGLIYWASAIGAAGALLFGGRLTERIGAAGAAAIGSGLYAAAMGIIGGGGPGCNAGAAGVLLGAGWALVFTAAPIIASSMPGRAPARTRFLVLAGFNALGMGATPIAGQLLVSRGVSYQDVFAVAAVLGLCAAALFALLAGVMPAQAATARADGAARSRIGPARLVLASGVGPFLLMVALGACVFTTMTSYQATFAASRGLNPSVFYACYTAGVIIPRFTVARLLSRTSPATATTALLAGMCLSLAGFLLAGHDLVGYAASSALLGVTYGLAYPLIQAQAVSNTPDRLRHWALWYFSLAYFAGIYGFPLIAGAIIVVDGYQALIACLLVIAGLELALSIKTQHARQRAPRRPAGIVTLKREPGPGLRSVGSITLVKEMMALPLDEASVKVRTGPPDDGHGPGAALGR